MRLELLYSTAATYMQDEGGTAPNVTEDPVGLAAHLLESAKEFAMNYWPQALSGVLVLIFGWMAAKIVRSTIAKLMRRAKVDETLVTFMTNLVYMGSMAFVFIIALGQFGINTTSFAAVIAAAGLAIGFALQGSLGNFAAGAMIIMLRPFKVGDYIEAAGTAGTVEAISVFATSLKTPDNKVVIIPNGSVTGGNIVNYSTKPQRRVDMVMGISYSDDIAKAKALFEKILADHPKVLADPAPKVAVQALADSSVNIVVRPWVNSADYWDVYFDITEQVKLGCDEAGISIPFPQRDVHLHQVA